jgi:type IV fimbrial biogenesis protein FimT
MTFLAKRQTWVLVEQMGAASLRGFSAIELMIVVAILAILTTLAAPSMGNLVRDQRVKTAVGDVHAALMFARSEAIKRNVYVGMCAMTDDGWGCQNSTDWARGWIVYLDADGNGYPGAVADVLKRQDALSNLSLTGTGGNVSFQGDGRVRVAPAAFVASIAGNNAVTARCVGLDLSGRPNVKVDTNSNPADGCN